ncbi:MAG TPA: TraR/DksA C4-type zinc finger protein [Candidatus Saccharimonadales bacterium]|jgi:DnaK suppressor protein|nr:TraR/DksA C4-type zinc finger protein [Candidatus Saccharimonadales bacterium]
MTEKTKKIKVKDGTPSFPSNVLTPVAHFLTARLHTLEKRKKEISKEDPFADPSRVDDNAAPDTEADEQFGHARTSAIKKEINKSIIGIRKALTRIKVGKYGICEECGQMIDTARLIAFPEATLCTKDAKKLEK